MQLDMMRPFWLALLLLALPPVIYFSRRSLVHFARWQRSASLAVRVALVVLLVAALCGIRVTTAVRQQFVVFAVDGSASIPAASRQTADGFVAQAAQNSGEHHTALMAFGAEPGPVTAVDSEQPPAKLAPIPGHETDVAAAIAEARAAIPQTCLPQIVLLTDGYQTTGDALAAARATGVPISVKPLPGRPSNEIRVPLVKPRVLLIQGGGESTARLKAALTGDLIDVEVRPSAKMPSSLAELRNYDLLMLCNVAAESLSSARTEAMQQFVGELGGGLIVLGGDQAFTAGGYRSTALEELLPVVSNLNLAMVLVIDESGSMEEEGRIDLAKEASKRVVNTLGSRDLLGVIGFGDRTRWISPVQTVSDEQVKQEICRRIDTISTARVNTILYPAMEEAFAALDKTGADLKHMIVLTDANDLTAGYYQGEVHAGVHKAAQFETLTRKILAAGGTVSMVAVGKGSDVAMLQELAKIGDQVHCDYRDNPTELPAMFAEDLRQRIAAGRRGVIEGTFTPQVVNEADVPADFDLRQMPPLAGYVETLPKEDGAIILATRREGGYPLLAWRPYRRGLSVAFTSRAEGPWAESWTQWPGYDRFWAQLVRHAARQDESKRFLPQAEWNCGLATFLLDAFDRQNGSRYLNRAEGALSYTDPEGNSGKAALVQIAPGRYAATFPAGKPGDYRLWATLRRGDQALQARPYGLLIRAADASSADAVNEPLLRSIAEATGGRYDPKPDDVFALPQTTAPRSSLLWPYLLSLAALLWLIDVTLKRIDLSRRTSG